MNSVAGSAYYHRARGSWKLKALFAIDGTGVRRAPTIADTDVYAEFVVTEPLLMSPFISGSGYGKQGFYGIQTMNFQMNMAPTANRAWRSAAWYGQANPVPKTISIHSFTDSKLLFQFLAPRASDMLGPRKVLPFYELPVYRTANSSDLAPRPNLGNPISGVSQNSATTSLHSSNTQLGGIPDKLVIFVRKPPSTLNCTQTDSYATISGISIDFNNQAGLLSSMTPEQLYRNSVQSGLANMSWDEFCGTTVSVIGDAAGINCGLRSPYSGVGANALNQYGVKYSPTTGTILILNFAEVIQLSEEYYAPGSLGSFNLQIKLDVQNNTYENWPGGSYEMVIIPMNSGVFVSERGMSSTFLSLLTKQDVLDALQQQPYSNFEIRRMVGGGFLDGLKSALGWVKGKLPGLRNTLEMIPNEYAQTGAKVIRALGYGQGHKSIDNRIA
jgi:hypothetical protein